MKKKFFVICAIFAMSLASAQEKNNVTFSPLGLVNKVRFKYEHSLDNNFSVGSFASMYWGLFPGLQIAPFGRYYFGDEGPEGVYLQAKLLAGFHEYVYDNDLKNSFSSFGGGLGIGYQKFTGKNKNIVIDVGVGFKLMTPPSEPSAGFVGDFETGVYLITGPGSFFDGLLSVGISF